MASSDSPERTLWIIAGANGSGKSSAYQQAALDAPVGAIWIINPDLLAKRIAEQENLPLLPEANLEAVRRIETWLYASVHAHQTIGVETVLATGKYRALVDNAHGHGFRVRLLYVFLENADLNVDRVRIRVAQGGHNVAEDRIRDRRARSFDQLAWFFEHADQADIYDNSGAEPELVVRKLDDEITVSGDLIPELAATLEVAVPGIGAALGAVPKPARRGRRRRRRRGRRTSPSSPAGTGR